MALDIANLAPSDLADFRQAMLDNGLPLTQSVHVTSAQLKAIHSSPIEIIAAQGAGKVVVPVMIAVTYNFVSAAYLAIDTPTFLYGTDTDNGPYAQVGGLNWIGGASSKFGVLSGPFGASNSGALTGFVNAPINLMDSANWTTGGGDLDIVALYTVLG